MNDKHDQRGQFASQTTHEAIIHRQRSSYMMRLAGASYDDIARAQGVSRTTAFLDVRETQRAIDAEAYEEMALMRAQSAARLDMMLFAVLPMARKGDYKSIKAALAIEKRRAELLGLDAPRKFEHTGENGGPIETTGTINIREQWSPQEAAEKARELTRRLEVISRETQRQAEERKAERN